MAAGHPRFLYPPTELRTIRATLSTSRARNWQACRQAAEAARHVTPPSFPDYQQEGPGARFAAQQYLLALEDTLDSHLLNLCLAYLVTGNDRYAIPAKRILLAVADWPVADRDVTSLTSPWGDGVGLSLCRCLHRGYDWLYTAMNGQERSRVAAACTGRARQAYRRLLRQDFLCSPGESHNGRLVVYLAEMAVVLAHETPEAETWLDYAMKALTTFYPHWGGSSGGWSEGPAYALWYALMALPGLEAIERATGFELMQRPFFKKWPSFIMQCTAIRGEASPFGDGAEQIGPGNDEERKFVLLMWYFAHRYNDSAAGWWAARAGGTEGLKGELALLYEDRPPMDEAPDLPNGHAFRETGWAALHSNIRDPEQDTFLLFRSSPYGSVSHGHADQNSFCIFRGGRALVVPSGYFWPVAGMPHHAQWTRTTHANNTVLVDGEGQPVADRSAAGKIVAYETLEHWAYTAGEAGVAYAGRLRRFTRHLLFLRPDIVLLLDELEAPQPVTYSWLLHSFEPMDVDPAAARVGIRRLPATLQIHVRATTTLTFRQTDTFFVPINAGVPEPYRQQRADQWHLRVDTTERTPTLQLAAAMITGEQSQPIEYCLLEGNGWFGVARPDPKGSAMVCARLTGGSDEAPGFGRTAPGTRFCGIATDGTRFAR